MKRILFVVLDVLLAIIICMFMIKGLNIGPIRIRSFRDIAYLNDELTQKIAEANNENQKYDSKLETIKKDTEDLTKAKKSYLDLMTVSTDSEIQQALQTKTYAIEYLWSKVGNYATKEGVEIKMELESSNFAEGEYKNIKFTVTGKYLPIINFILELENDSSLDFTIDNFNMEGTKVSKDGKENVQMEICKFVIRDVKIIKENTSSQSESKPEQSESNSNDKENKSSTNETSSTESNKKTNETNETNDVEKTKTSNETNENSVNSVD